MRLVEKPIARPMRCAVLPFQHDDPRGWVDCEWELPGLDPRVYVSYTGVEALAGKFGFVPADTHADLQEQVVELERENRRLKDEVDDLNRDFEAIDVLESRGYTKRRKPGRPRKEVGDGA